MATDAQIAANRRNALKSTGPKTDTGRTIVRWNALRHGTFSPFPLLPGESKTDFIALRDAYLSLYQPENQSEQFLVNRMILAAWRLSRLAAMEVRVIRAHGRAEREHVEWIADLLASLRETEPRPAVKPFDPVARAFIRDSAGSDTVSKFARYQTSLERSYYRALHELERLRAPRP